MSFHIRKITPNSRLQLIKIVPKPVYRALLHNPSKSLSRTPATSDQSPESVKIKPKISIQTIITKKSTIVQQLNISSTSWCLYDENKSKYVGFRQKHQRQIASLTKIMTTIVGIQFLLDNQIKQDFYVKVTESAAHMIGTTAELKVNTWIKIWDLLYGTMLPSGNDAAYLLSQAIGYLSRLDKDQIKLMTCLDISEQNTSFMSIGFVKLMNKKAEDLKLQATTFSNPHGLQNALNTSCPKDIINLSIYASKNQKFRKIMNTDTARYYYLQENKQIPPGTFNQQIIASHTKSCRKRWWNTNKLLDQGWQGIKTGQTGSAGSCLASLKKGIYIVVLNCKDNQARFTQTLKIYNWYIAKQSNKLNTESSDSLII